jgi:hypothetical protein
MASQLRKPETASSQPRELQVSSVIANYHCTSKVATSAGLCSSDNWVPITEKDERTIQAAKMRFLKSTLGVLRQDRLTNEAVRKTQKVNSFNDSISKYRHNLTV